MSECFRSQVYWCTAPKVICHPAQMCEAQHVSRYVCPGYMSLIFSHPFCFCEDEGIGAITFYTTSGYTQVFACKKTILYCYRFYFVRLNKDWSCCVRASSLCQLTFIHFIISSICLLSHYIKWGYFEIFLPFPHRVTTVFQSGPLQPMKLKFCFAVSYIWLYDSAFSHAYVESLKQIEQTFLPFHVPTWKV